MTSSLSPELQQLEQLILQKLPIMIENSPPVQKLVTELAEHRKEATDKFYQLLGELRRDREEQARKWDDWKREWQEYKVEDARKWNDWKREWQEYKIEDARKWEEQNRKWDEQNRKWDEQSREWKEYTQKQDRKWEEQTQKWNEQDRRWHETQEGFKAVHEEIRAMIAKHERSIGALGARWGMQSEASFRHALAAILEKSFGVQVINVNEYDDEGTVFGRPDQVELDVIIKNGLVIICEIKSSIDKAGMYIFERKVRFYEKRHQRTVSRMIVISPMVDLRAKPVAERLGIEVYSDSIDVKTEL